MLSFRSQPPRRPRSGPKVVGLLGLLVGLPGLVLAYFGVLSVRSEAVVARAQFQERCEEVAADLYGELERRFAGLDQGLLRGVSRAGDAWVDPTATGDALVAALPDVEGLLVLDGNGSILYPPPNAISLEDATFRRIGDVDRSFMGESFRLGEDAEIRGDDPAAAAAAYAASVPGIPGDRGKALAMNAWARALLKDGRPGEARAVWQGITRDHPGEQDWNGFPLATLARYQIGLSYLQQGELVPSARAFSDLLADQMRRPWSYGGFAEGVIARKLLLHLDSGRLVEALPPGERPDLDAARAHFAEASRRQRDQAATLALLPVLREDRATSEDARVQYSRDDVGDVRILTARVRWSAPGVKRLFIFTLDEGRLLGRLRDLIAGAARVNPEIRISLVDSREGPLPLRSSGEGALYSLEPWVAGMMLVVGRGDPSKVDAQLARARGVRVGMVAAFTLLILFGAGVTARAVLREMDIARLRTDFVSNVSHELRTPITTIRLMGEMLAMGAVPTEEKRREYYQTIVTESERLSRLINNVLDFARLEEGRKKFRFALADVGECVRQVARTTADYLHGEGFEFEVEVAPDLPRLWFDSDAIVQALVNLLTNAVKYSRRERRVRLTARRERSTVVLAVRDRGEGIDPKDLKHIFEKFYRGGDALTRETRGAGLGLSIVRAIVDAHGGKVRVESRPGQGSTFSIVLPVRKEPPADLPTPPEEQVA